MMFGFIIELDLNIVNMLNSNCQYYVLHRYICDALYIYSINCLGYYDYFSYNFICSLYFSILFSLLIIVSSIAYYLILKNGESTYVDICKLKLILSIDYCNYLLITAYSLSNFKYLITKFIVPMKSIGLCDKGRVDLLDLFLLF